MFSGRLRELSHTSGFRFGFLFLALFGMASAMLFGFVYWRADAYLRQQTDDWLRREIKALPPSPSDAVLAQRVDGHVAADRNYHRPFGLFDAQGHRLAGGLAALPPRFETGKPLDYRIVTPRATVAYRGIVWRAPSGKFFAAAQNLDTIHGFERELMRALLIGSAAMLLLGLCGAVALGASAVRRMRAMTRAIERIVGGDLAERLPIGGNSGDIDRLAAVVNTMLDEIERLMGEVKGVCDNIAHDMRTPLTRLLAGLDRARRRDLDKARLAEAVDGAIAEVKAILQTFAAMLRISEIEDGARRSGFAPVDLAAVVEDIADYYGAAAEARGIALTHDAGAEPAILVGDRDLLFEAIGNLVDNAIKFTPSGGEIRILLRAGPRISVLDTGPGIPQMEREHVLQRFHRVEGSRSTPGNGLGLPLVAAIARLHRLDLSIAGGAPGCAVHLAA